MEVIYQNYGLEEAYFLLIVIPVMLVLYYFIRRKGAMNRKKWFFLFTRFVLVSLIAITLESPFITDMEKEYQDITSVKILHDRSESMSVFGESDQEIGRLYRELKAIVKNSTGYDAVELKNFSEGNKSSIGDVLYQETLTENKENTLLILSSDGNNNYGKSTENMGQILRDANITVSAIVPEVTENDVYVKSLEGKRKTPANSDYGLKIVIGKEGNERAEYRMDLRLDGRLLHTSREFQSEPESTVYFTFSVEDAGSHEIKVGVSPQTEDKFEENNVLMKSLDVVEKPEILLLTEDENSPLVSVLENSYEVSVVDDLRYQDLYGYDAVIVDNQPSSKFGSRVVNSLYDYIVDGNGLIVVGGDKSYEKGNYLSSQFETLLPVRSTEPPEKKRKEIVAVFLIDISESTGYGAGGKSKVDVEKALAINMIEQLDPQDRVGLIAFNVDAYVISDARKLEDHKEEIIDKIKRLRFGGGTDMYAALANADAMLDRFSGDRNVILISDGVIKRLSRQEPTISQVRSLNDQGIKVYTIGVGFDTDTNFMTRLAEAGGGQFFGPEEYQRLKLEFEEKEKEEKSQYVLEIYNRYHFITRNLRTPYFPSISQHNGVTERSISQVLLTTRDNMPILTVCRFGLGRVVSLTTDNGLEWAPNIYLLERYNKVIPGMTNWAIGNLEKRKRVNIETDDIFVGETAEFTIKSEKEPVLKMKDGEQISLTQKDVDLYTGEKNFNEEGYYRVAASSSLGSDTDAVAVNYPEEINELGIDKGTLLDIVIPTNGKIYNSSNITELKEDVIDYVQKGSSVIVRQKTSLQFYFLAATISLFFLDVIFRRLFEIIRLRKKG